MTNLATFEFDELPRGAGGIGATENIARALNDCGINAPVTLYDEALALAREGRLAPASERLRMLLCLDPTDAEASLLLGKVLASRGLWQQALTHLDTATANGAVLPPGLRDSVDAALRQQVQTDEEHRARIAARERGEIRNLRAEAKRLRSENASLDQNVIDLEKRVRLWSSVSAVVAGSAAALLLAVVAFGGDPETTQVEASATSELASEETAPEAPAQVAAPAPAPVEAPAPAPAVVAKVEAPAPAAKKVSNPSGVKAVHTVKKGDTLGGIAGKYYGNSAKWPEIQKANSEQLGKGIDLKLGMKLTIPEI